MGRQIHTKLSQTKKSLITTWHYFDDFKRKNEREKIKQKQNFDLQHRVHSLPVLPDDTPVRVTSDTGKIPGNNNHQAETQRSYVVNTPSGQVHRNRCHLTVRADYSTETSQNENTAGDKDSSSPTENTSRISSRSSIMSRSCIGAVVNSPDRLTF